MSCLLMVIYTAVVDLEYTYFLLQKKEKHSYIKSIL